MKYTRLEASLQISRNNEEKQYETMKTRIKYMYENGSETMITMLFTADSMGDFLNKAEFIQNITDYDKEMLENMMEILSRYRDARKRILRASSRN